MHSIQGHNKPFQMTNWSMTLTVTFMFKITVLRTLLSLVHVFWLNITSLVKRFQMKPSGYVYIDLVQTNKLPCIIQLGCYPGNRIIWPSCSLINSITCILHVSELSNLICTFSSLIEKLSHSLYHISCQCRSVQAFRKGLVEGCKWLQPI